MGDEDQVERPDGRRDGRRSPMRELDKERRSRLVRIGVALFLLVLFILFVIQNSKPVSRSSGVDFVFVTADVRLIWVFLVCGLVGALVGYLLGRPSRAQREILKRLEDAQERP
jgi:uncharacterized integral membrane protein